MIREYEDRLLSNFHTMNKTMHCKRKYDPDKTLLTYCSKMFHFKSIFIYFCTINCVGAQNLEPEAKPVENHYTDFSLIDCG